MRKSLIFVSQKSLIYLYTALFLVTPLIFTTFTDEIFEFPKTIFFYAIASLIIYFYLILIIWGEQKLAKPKLTLVLVAMAFIISTVFSEHIHTSIWGYYGRFFGGSASWLLLIAVAYIFENLYASGKNHKHWLNSITAAAILVSIYAVLQKTGIDKNLWVQDSQQRVFSTFGQPNWLAAYLTAVAIPAAGVYLHAIKRKYVYLVIFALLYVSTLFTNSLSGFLAMGICLLTLITIALMERINKTKIIKLILTAILLTAITPNAIAERITNIPEQLSLAGAHASATTPTLEESDTGKIRLIVWKGSLDLWTSSPKNFLIGTGPETFAYAFLPHRPIELNYTSEWEFLFNKPHNIFIEWLTTLGLTGFLAFSYFIYKTIGTLKTKKHNIAAAGISLGFVSLLISGFFGWLTVSTAILFVFYPLLARNYET